MSDASGGIPIPPSPIQSAKNPTVEDILKLQFPLKVFAEAIVSLNAPAFANSTAAKDIFDPIQAQREKLLERPESELREMLQTLKAQAKARQEAAKFYNLTSAKADLGYWAKAEYWTFDEAVALLLGREPTKVTWEDVQRELAPYQGRRGAHREPDSKFLSDYQRLRNLAMRAPAMQSPRLKPADVLAWALDVRVVEPPSQLIALLARDRLREQEPEQKQLPTGATHAGARTNTNAPLRKSVAHSDRKPWTDAELAKMQAFRKTHTAKATANYFGISETRMRELLAKEPPLLKASNPFNLGGPQ
jgi:hypothetical protein